MKKYLLFCTLFFVLAKSYSQAEFNTWSVKFSKAIMGRYQPNINTMTNKGWEYSNGIILCGMQKVWAQLSTTSTKDSIKNYIQNYVDAYVNSSGIVNSKIWSTLGLDGTHPGLLCVWLYQQTGLTKYKTAAQHLRDTIISLGYPKTAEGGYWHRNDATNYKDVEYLDGVYMVNPFLAAYGQAFNDAVALDTAVDQTIIMYNHMYSGTTHLVKHALDYSKTYPTPGGWSVPGTQLSSQVWSRGMGWYMLTLIEILSSMPHSHPKYGQMLTILGNLATGIKNYQDPTTGLWCEIVDSPKTAQNYIETSGSGMFIYALKEAIDSGWISSATYLPVVNNAWTGYKTFIKTYAGPAINGYSGGPQITSFTPALSVQATYTNYVTNGAAVNVPTNTGSGTQNPHGYAATLMAASAMEFPIVTLPVKFTSFTAALGKSGDVEINWANEDDGDVAYYAVQRSADGTSFNTISKIQRNGSLSYNFDDNTVTGSVAYYRIQAVNKDGAPYYSKVLFVKLKSLAASISVSPNPITDGVVHIRFENIPAGNYNVRIINSDGKSNMVKQVQVSTDQDEETITLSPSVEKGIHYVVLEAGNTVLVKTILINK